MNKILVGEKNLEHLNITMGGIQKLEKIGLLPFKIKNNEIYRLFIHLFGLRYSDGCIYEQKRNNSFTFYICFGGKNDANSLIEDCRSIWNIDVKSCYSSRAYYVYLPADIGRLMMALGSPEGRKTTQIFRLPKWIFRLPSDLKWEFIGGLFSGDGSCPRLQPIGTCSCSLLLSLSCEASKADKFCKGFMNDVENLLGALGVKTSKPKVVWSRPRMGKDGVKTHPVHIRILTEKKNMIKFLENIPYRYSQKYDTKAKEVIDALKGDAMVRNLRLQLKAKAAHSDMAVLLNECYQRYLIETALNKFGKYKLLAEYLHHNCPNLSYLRITSLRDNYIPDWRNGKRFIPVDYLKILADVCELKIESVEQQIEMVRLFKSSNKFAIQLR